MKKLAPLLLLTAAASALAGGGGGPRPVFPLAAGQVWQLTYQITGQPTQHLERTLQREDLRSPDHEGVRSFDFSLPPVPGEAMAVWPRARYLTFGLQEPHLLCITPNKAPKSSTGYLLAGPMDAWDAALPQRQPNDNYNDAEVYLILKKARLGTCTLTRLR